MKCIDGSYLDEQRIQKVEQAVERLLKRQLKERDPYAPLLVGDIVCIQTALQVLRERVAEVESAEADTHKAFMEYARSIRAKEQEGVKQEDKSFSAIHHQGVKVGSSAKRLITPAHKSKVGRGFRIKKSADLVIDTNMSDVPDIMDIFNTEETGGNDMDSTKYVHTQSKQSEGVYYWNDTPFDSIVSGSENNTVADNKSDTGTDRNTVKSDK